MQKREEGDSCHRAITSRVPRCAGRKGAEVPRVAAERKPQPLRRTMTRYAAADARPSSGAAPRTRKEREGELGAAAGKALPATLSRRREQSGKCFRITKLKNKCQLWET